MNVSPRILVLTPWVPYPVTGACQQDRFYGLKQMQSLGYDLSVIARIHDFQPRTAIEEAFRAENIALKLVPHTRNILSLLWKRFPRILRSPALLDGAALEYTDPAYERTVRSEVARFKPDLIWIEYTPLWPVLRLLRPSGIPTIVKSSLNEPKNCRDENGWSIASIIKSLPKYRGETIAARESDYIFGITPVEEEWYKRRGAEYTGTLPLRGLSRCFTRRAHQDKHPLDVVFLSSNYNMGHNRDALLFLLQRILPEVRLRAPGRFRFHLTGSKFPDRYRLLLGDDANTTGFLPDLGAFLATMDIALCPWISGHGMQQKVFEPLCRGIPLITTKTAGYPFEPGQEVRFAETPGEYVDHLLALEDAHVRQAQADAAYEKAYGLFSEEAVKRIVADAVSGTMKRRNLHSLS